MRAISPPSLLDGKLYSAIAAAKHEPRRTTLVSIRTKVLGAYKEYRKAAPEVDKLPAMVLDADQAKALIHAYEVDTEPFIAARGKLLDRVDASFCPLCDIGEATTLDHYLPKDDYPAFSVFSRNLVPCCSACNTRKKKLVIDQNTNVRTFFHPYFDQIPTQQFLSLRVRIGADTLALTFSVKQVAGMNAAQSSQLQTHFAKLRLAKRFNLRSLSLLRDRYPAFRRWFDQGGAGRFALEMNQEAADLELARQHNHWNVVLFRTLAANEAFCGGGFEVLPAIQ